MTLAIRTLTTFARRRPRATPVFDTYWRFAAERQRVFHARATGSPAPWTSDSILAKYRFTNAYRAADRVSQFLINEVLPGSLNEPHDMAFRTLLFKVFNRVRTWQRLEAQVGELHAGTFSPMACATVLSQARMSGEQVYSAAYIMPMPAMPGAAAKHEAHLALIEDLLRRRMIERVADARSLEHLFMLLSGVPSFGPFLAFQFAIDINYAPALNHSEMQFVVAGPGARSGIEKCFSELDGLSYEDIIRYTCERAQEEFAAREIVFADLWGRPLQLIDCQNLFCEVDKYSRVAHPEVLGAGGRTRIKQRYSVDAEPLGYGFPITWQVTVPEQLRWTKTQAAVRTAN
jgi:alpha-glutamyl/putrescinyl thymine pyrophosphorylase clade 1